MHDKLARKATRTIRITLSNEMYARLAFLAAKEGVSITEFARIGLMLNVVGDGMVSLDAAAEFLELELRSQHGQSADPSSETES